MRVCFLGTGGSWPTKRRNPISIALSSGSTNVLLDCGEGTQKQMLFSPVSPNKLDAIFITHLHGDHFLGVPGLIQTMSLNDRTEKLLVFGPEGIESSMEKALTMCHFQSRFEIRVRVMNPGDTVKVGELNFRAGRARHNVPSLAYRIFLDDRPGRFNRDRALELGIPEGRLWGRLQKGETVEVDFGGETREFTPEMVLGPPRKGVSIGYSGDTAPSKDVEELVKNVDLLIHEATFTSDLSENARKYGHSTAAEAALLAGSAKVSRLYIVHPSPRYAREGSEAPLLEEARNIFPETYLPEDLECIEVIR